MADNENPSRRNLLKAIGAALGSTLMTSQASTATAAPATKAAAGQGTKRRNGAQPNILWMNLEGVPTHLLSCYGGTLMQTPNIDRIAREGLKFRNAFCTNALCAPSRSTLLTGKYTHLTGMTTNPDGTSGEQAPAHFDPAQPTFPKILQQAGYQTAIAGKWHLDPDPGKVGFDSFIYKLGAGGPYYDPTGFLENPSPGSPVVLSTKHEGYETDVFTDWTIDAIKRMTQSGKPFMMMYAPFNPHRPFDPPHKYENLYRGKRIPEPGTFWDDYSQRATAAGAARIRLEYMPDFKPPAELSPRQRQQWNYQRYMAHYLGALRALDDNVGRLLEFLDASGLAEDTIVMLSADHGFFLGDHGWFDKRLMYEEAIRVPWMIRWPGRVKPGSETDAWTINIDNAPTTLELAGIAVPGDMQGRSLLPLFDGSTPKDWQRALYYHYYEFANQHWIYPHYGVRTERYKLISYYRQNEWDLFDLQNDPDEMDSLFEWNGYQVRRGYEKVVDDLVAQLKALREQYKDETGWPVKFVEPKDYD